MKPQDIVRQTERVFGSEERNNFERQWELLSEFILPNQSGIFTGGNTATNIDISGNNSIGPKGSKKTRRLFDSTAIQANQDLSSAIYSALFGGSARFIKLKFRDEELNDNDELIEWLEESVNRMHQALTESNLNTELAKALRMYSSLGSMALIEESKGTGKDGFFQGFRFKSYHIAQVSWLENEDGLVDVLYRKFSLTAKQVEEKWPDNLPLDVVKALSKGQLDKEFDFVHCIMPRKEGVEEGLTTPDKRPIGSYYIYLNEPKKFIEEGGYYEFPAYIVRWDTIPGEVYGRGPGYISLPDVRTLNKAKELALDSIARATRAPILANQRDVIGQLDLSPGSVSLVRDINGVREMPSQTQFDVTQLAVEDLRDSIRRVFFLDKLILPPRTETGEMTAFEIAQRIEQIQKVLGSTFGRLNKELLEPMVVRSFKIMLREGAFPELPAELSEKGIDVDIVFINQLARSQQMEEINTEFQWLQRVALIAQYYPQALDLIDFDEYIKGDARKSSVSEKLLRDPKITEGIREQRAQQEAGIQQEDSLVKGADVISKLSSLPGGTNV